MELGPLTHGEKPQFMKNSLIKHALALVLSGEIGTPQDLIEFIGKAYGLHQSPEKL